MIKANIEAAIEAKEKERVQVLINIEKLNKIISDLIDQKYKLLEDDSNLYYEIEELKERLNEL